MVAQWAVWLAGLSHVSCVNHFLHVSDIHFDVRYVADSSPAAYCHRGSGNAGVYGVRGPNCGTPQSLLDQTLQKMKLLDADLVAVTGDNVRLDIDAALPLQVEEWNDAMKYVSSSLVSELSNSKIVMAIGDTDVMPGTAVVRGPQSAFLDKLAELWVDVVPEDQVYQFQDMGVYERRLSSELNVLVLNTLFLTTKYGADCADTTTGGYAEMRWVRSKLQEYLNHEQHAYLVGYQAPGVGEWEAECLALYEDLSVEFETVLQGHFYGRGKRDHQDTFHTLPICGAAMLVAPSLVPTYNVAVRMYEFDQMMVPGSFPRRFAGHLESLTQLYADISEVNKDGQLRELLPEYTAAVNLSMTSLSSDGWKNLSLRAAQDPALAATLAKIKTVSSVQIKQESKVLGLFFSVLMGLVVMAAGVVGVLGCLRLTNKTYDEDIASGRYGTIANREASE